MMRVKPLLAALAATFITLGPVGAWAANEAPATAAAYAPTFVPTKAKYSLPSPGPRPSSSSGLGTTL